MFECWEAGTKKQLCNKINNVYIFTPKNKQYNQEKLKI